MLDQPKPKPGQKVYGTISFKFPKGKGILVFADRAGAEMFRVKVSR